MKKPLLQPLHLQDIAAHRQFIYGVSALWILIHHMNTTVPYRGMLRLLNLIQETGTCGVEVFLFLTGFGLYGALNRNPDILRFYKRRLVRTLLPALVVFLCFDLFACPMMLGMKINLHFLLTWPWSGGLWYVSFILVMYLIYPLLHKWNRPENKKGWIVAFAVSFAACFLLEILSGGIAKEIMRPLTRIPVFLLGCMLALPVEANRSVPRWSLPCLLIGSAVGTVVWKLSTRFGYLYSVRMLVYLFMGAAIIMLLVVFAQLLQKLSLGRGIYKAFLFCGSISLEIYLVFDRVRELMEFVPGITNLSSAALDLLAAVFTIPLAWLLRMLCSRIADRLAVNSKIR